MKDRQPKPAAAKPRRASAGSRLRTPADAAADVDRVVESYVQDVILEESPSDPDGMYWWWPRAAWVDPNQLIVDTEAGGLVRVPFSTNDQQEITFAAPVEVLEQFVDLAPSAKAQVFVAAAQGTREAATMRVFESRDDVPGLPKRDPSAGVPDPGNNVGMTPEQLKALGLAEDATQEQIDTRIAELTAAEQGGEGSGEGGEGSEGEGSGTGSEGGESGSEGGESAGGEGEQPPAQASGPRPGMVEVPAEAWEQVQANAAAGAAVATQNEESRRDDTIAAACSAGKISPSASASMKNLHGRDPEAFYNLLTASVDKGGLAPNLVPVTPQGGAGGGQDAASASSAISDADMARMFPEVAVGGRG